MTRPPVASRLTGLIAAIALSAASGVAPALAQETRVLASAGTVPRQSVVQVSALPPPAAGERAHTPRPRLWRDPRALAMAKEMTDSAAAAERPETEAAPRGASAPAVVVTAFEGVSNADDETVTGFTVVPPDANLAVGPAHVFQIVNIVGRISDKAGGAASTFSLAGFFAIDPGADETDPRVIYDAPSGRWFATYAQATTTSSIVLAVSTSSDPTGSFCLYRLGNPTSETFIQDFPQLGVSADKVVVTYNGFGFSAAQPFIGAGYYVVNKADLLACGASPQVVRSVPDPSRFSLHPVQTLDGTSTLFVPFHSRAGQLTVLAIDGVPGVSPVVETAAGLPVRSWTVPPNALQAGSTVRLDTGDDAILSGALRNSSLWLAGNEGCLPAGDGQVRSCLRVVEVRTDSMTVRQDMTLADLGQYYYYPALRPDVDGNLQMVFNASSASDFAGLRTSGQRVSDPLNTLGGAAPLRAGAGAQTTSSGRMGDYSGAAVDPADPHTVWVNGEYIRSMGPRNWGTLVAALAFPSPLPSVSLALSKPAAAPGRGLAFTGGDTLQVDLTVANPGSAVAVDVYFGMVLPPAAGFSLGCLNGDPVAFFTNSLATTVVTCLSSPPQSFPALFQGATIPAGVAPTTLVNFWSFVWPATAPVGPYTVFVALTVPGALADGVLAPGDLIAVSTADASFLP